MYEFLVIAGFLLLTVAFPVLIVYGILQIRRDKDRTGTISSGVAGMMAEVDRLVRPSVQHVVESKESAEDHHDETAGQ